MEAFVKKLKEKLKEKERIVLGDEREKLFSQSEESAIKKLYLMYEFSDRVRLSENSPQYGCLQNYVEMGLLTQKEAERVALM